MRWGQPSYAYCVHRMQIHLSLPPRIHTERAQLSACRIHMLCSLTVGSALQQMICQPANFILCTLLALCITAERTVGTRLSTFRPRRLTTH